MFYLRKHSISLAASLYVALVIWGTAHAAPDLTGTFEPIENTTISQGDKLPLQINLTSGDDDSGPCEIRFYLSNDTMITGTDMLIGTSHNRGVFAGTSTIGYAAPSITIAPGSYYVGAIIDAANAVAESDETNNTLLYSSTTRIVVGAAVTPDLSGVFGYTNFTTLNQGDALHARTYVTSADGASGPHTTRFYLSADTTITGADMLIGEHSSTVISTGFTDSAGIYKNITVAAGSYYLGAIIDATNAVAESDETNNTVLFSTTQIIVNSGSQDLSGRFAAVTPTTLKQGDALAIEFDATSANGACGANVTEYYLSADATIDSSDTLIGTYNSTGISSGATELQNLSPTISIAAGSYYLGAIIDATNTVSENDESNNTIVFSRQIIVNVGVVPDLTGSFVDATPSTLSQGDTLNIEFDTTSAGNAAGAQNTVFFLSEDATIDTHDTRIATYNSGGIASGGTEHQNVSGIIPVSSFPPGNYYLGAIVDAGSTVTESDETNNTVVFSTQIIVNAKYTPDLIGSFVDVTPTTFESGDALTIEFDTTSTRGACVAHVTEYYLSTDLAISSSDTLIATYNSTGISIDGTEPQNVSSTISIAAGSYYLGAIIDATNTVSETDEANNTIVYSKQIVVDSPNTAPTATITSPADGTTTKDGTSLLFAGTGNDTEDGALPDANLVWTSDIDGAIGTGTSFLAPLTVGTHAITLTVTDSGGISGSDNIIVVVQSASSNTAPTTAIVEPTDGDIVHVGTGITFKGTGNDTEDGRLPGTSLVWSSSIDGPIGTGRVFTTAALSAGTHTITLLVTDSGGLTDSYTITFTVKAPNAAPVATITAPVDGTIVTAGATVNFTGTGADTEDGALPDANLAWTSDIDGALGTGASLSTPALAVGTHTITLTATDSGSLIHVDTISITISAVSGNTAPVATITAPADGAGVIAGATVNFTGTGTDTEDGALPDANLAWTSDIDGALGTGASLSTSALAVGTHTITLTATDSGSLIHVDTISITISAVSGNTAPVATITAPADGLSVAIGETLVFSGAGADAEDGVLPDASLAWTSDIDGALGTGVSVSTAELTVGTHTITLTVTDSGAQTGTDTVTITILDSGGSHGTTGGADGGGDDDGDGCGCAIDDSNRKGNLFLILAAVIGILVFRVAQPRTQEA